MQTDSKFLIEGAIPADKIADILQKHQNKTELGGHTQFMGQVRADQQDGKTVEAIEYSAYAAMADKVFQEIKEEILNEYRLSCMHIMHSTGEVQAGDLSLFVMVSAPHRQWLFKALDDTVSRIKARAPIWKKEIYTDGTHAWPSNPETMHETNRQ